MSGTAIQVEKLVKNYGKVEALRGIDLDVEEGEMFALLGPNGAGKTTLFSILATLRKPTSGSARVLGHDVVTQRPTVRGLMSIVFQEPALEQKLSVRANLETMGAFYGLTAGVRRTRTDAVLEELGLADIADRRGDKLSGGQKRRVELARALVSDPRMLFLDEATLGLDVDGRRSFWSRVREISRSGRTVFFTTHYMEEAEGADRIALIHEGRIIALDTPRNLKNRVGGGVILLRTDDDERAASWLSDQGFSPESSERGLLLVYREPAELLPTLLRDAPVRIRRAEVHEPSLEDVFLTLTGKGLESGPGETPAPAAAGAAP